MHIYDESLGEIYTSHEDVMKRAAYEARLGVNHKLGGPFGGSYYQRRPTDISCVQYSTSRS